MEVSGGSHEIATAVTDLYSQNFRSGLVHWLKSIPHYSRLGDIGQKFDTSRQHSVNLTRQIDKKATNIAGFFVFLWFLDFI